MKAGFYLIILCIMHGFIEIHAQSLGFIEPECKVGPGSAYHIENYSQGSHGKGYRLYHNGKIIFGCFEEFSGCEAKYLKFLDDTETGFLIDISGFVFAVYKIEGDSVKHLWGTTGYVVHDAFIINAHALITVTEYQSVDIFKFSDVQPCSRLITFLHGNFEVSDTILGAPLCPDLIALNYRYKMQNDTATCRINLFYKDIPYNIIESYESNYNIFPNPSSHFLYLETNTATTIQSINIYNSMGVLINSILADPENEIDIHDLSPGAYYLVIESETGRAMKKLIKL